MGTMGDGAHVTNQIRRSTTIDPSASVRWALSGGVDPLGFVQQASNHVLLLLVLKGNGARLEPAVRFCTHVDRMHGLCLDWSAMSRIPSNPSLVNSKASASPLHPRGIATRNMHLEDSELLPDPCVLAAERSSRDCGVARTRPVRSRGGRPRPTGGRGGGNSLGCQGVPTAGWGIEPVPSGRNADPERLNRTGADERHVGNWGSSIMHDRF